MQPITSFSGEYRFLSNFWRCPVWIEYDGHKWETTEQAYQAAKLKPQDKSFMHLMDENKVTAAQSKKIGASIDIRPDWQAVKRTVMIKISEEKYNKNPDLMQALLETKGRELIEGNTWNDTYWGQCPIGNGRNELGKILMSIRDSSF